MPGFIGFQSPDERKNCGLIPHADIPASNLGRTDSFGIDSPEHTVETFRKYRYLMRLMDSANPARQVASGNNKMLSAYIETCTRPKLEFDKITIHKGQDEIYRPGKSRWAPITLSFYEAVVSKIDSGLVYAFSSQLAEVIYNWHSRVITGFDRSTSFSSIAGAKTIYKNIEIDMENGYGNRLRTYYLYEGWPSGVTPSDLSYSSNEITRIDVEITYNRAVEKYYDGNGRELD